MITKEQLEARAEDAAKLEKKLATSNAPTITKGPCKGDNASVDHIIPRSIVEELDEKLYSLEFMPSTLNTGKGNKIGLRQRQRQLAAKWHKLGLHSRMLGCERLRSRTECSPPLPRPNRRGLTPEDGGFLKRRR